MDYSIELIADFSCHIGENPIWHSDQQALYWLDIPQGRIFRYDAQNKKAELWFETNVIGGMTIQQGGELLLFMEAGRIALLKEGKLTTVVEKIEGEAGKRFNDVIASPSGSVFCGSFSYSFGEGDTGSLYQLHHDRTLQKVIDGVGIANGMGFSPDLDHFYFTDSAPEQTIYRYRYHLDEGIIEGKTAFAGKTVFATLPAEHGLPDGLTIDAAGYVWSARWDGGKVICFSPAGDIAGEIEIPGAKKVSSVTFGGPDYGDMYVTTAGGDDKSENGENAGALFCIRSEKLKGRPEYRSRLV